MGNTLYNTSPQNTYPSLIKLEDNLSLTGTLKTLSDGLGNDSVLALSTNSLQIGGTTGATWDNTNKRLGIGTNAPTSRLQVRGDGTNPVARFESSAGANFLLINNSGQAVFGSAGANEPYLVNYNGTLTESAGGHSLRIRQRANTGSTGNTLIQYWADGLFSGTTSGIAISHEFLSSGFSGAAGSGNYRNLSIGYTINNSGVQTGTATGIFLNATETALNGQTHNLMDLQKGGVSQFRVDNSGNLFTNNIAYVSTLGLGSGGTSFLVSGGLGIIRFIDAVGTSFNRLQLGGSTSSYPAIKRNGTGIDFKLADDSGLCGVNTGALNVDSFALVVSGTTAYFQYGLSIGFSGLNVASSVLELRSTTKGFLPPRMTTAQKNAITTPATGLVVFDTDLGKLCVFSVTWQTVTSI